MYETSQKCLVGNSRLLIELKFVTSKRVLCVFVPNTEDFDGKGLCKFVRTVENVTLKHTEKNLLLLHFPVVVSSSTSVGLEMVCLGKEMCKKAGTLLLLGI